MDQTYRRGLPLDKSDRNLVRDAQRVSDAIEAIVRIHTAQRQEIYDAIVRAKN